jgi:hypothetical protein
MAQLEDAQPGLLVQRAGLRNNGPLRIRLKTADGEPGAMRLGALVFGRGRERAGYFLARLAGGGVVQPAHGGLPV